MNMESLQELKEEIFCLKFELDVLSEVSLRNEAERWVPGFIHGITEHDHIERYKLACKYSKGRNVLDIACGVGKGAFMLGTQGGAKSVLGCDLNENSIRYAKHRNSADNVKFEVQNAETFKISTLFDLIISYETIEHLSNFRAFLSNISSQLTDAGTFIISTPISKFLFDSKPINPYHCQEWGFEEFQKLMGEFFLIENVYLQLYQNVFLNNKIKEEYEKDSGKSKSATALSKIGRIIGKRRISVNFEPVYYDEWNNVKNYSKISEYSEGIDKKLLGESFLGYQIIVCKSKKCSV